MTPDALTEIGQQVAVQKWVVVALFDVIVADCSQVNQDGGVCK